MEATESAISKQINSKMKIWIKSTGENDRLDGKLWAMNSLNLKSSLAYHLYLLLASPLAKKVGSRLVFKGKFNQLIEGDPRKTRSVLLIVRYENAHRFLDLVGNKLFQVFSLIRINAVKDFNFGFVQNLLESKNGRQYTRPDREKCFLSYHFSMSDAGQKELSAFIEAFSENDIEMVFAGIKAAEIGRETGGGQTQMMGLLFDGLCLFQADNFNIFDNLMNNSQFVQFKNKQGDNYIAHFSPTF